MQFASYKVEKNFMLLTPVTFDPVTQTTLGSSTEADQPSYEIQSLYDTGISFKSN